MMMQTRGLPQLAPRKSVKSAAFSRAPLSVRASAAGGPVPPEPTPSPPGTPAYQPPSVYLRASGPTVPATGAGTPTGGSGGYGGNRPVSTGGSGGSGGSGGLPSGWSWDRVLLTLLGIGLAVPAWRYLNRRFINKPEPEHTLTKAEDAAAGAKHKTHIPNPIKAIKHSEPVRALQHKAEDVKDAADVGTYNATSKTDRAVEHGKKDVKHAVEDTKVKGGDVGATVDQKTHEAGVKGSRGLQRTKEKVADTVYHAEEAVAKGGKGVIENIKGAAHSVGRKLHVVGDNAEKSAHKAAKRVEDETDDRTWWYVGGGVALGTGVLTALYFWDRSGGDLKGKVRKLQDTAMGKAKEARDVAKDVIRSATTDQAPAGPTRP